jgi:lipoate-protein ligase B
MQTKTELRFLDLGQVSYAKAYEVQKDLVEVVAFGRAPSTIIACEHFPVITYGRRSRRSNILASKKQLDESGVEVCFADRGGDVTFHGPGQIVLYPILDLRHFGKDLHRYIRVLEEAVIRVLRQEYTLNAYRQEGFAGVWVGPYKVASIGIGVRRWVAYHGMSINVRTDKKFFKLLRSCGSDVPIASLSSFFRDELISMKKIKESVIKSLVEVL